MRAAVLMGLLLSGSLGAQLSNNGAGADTATHLDPLLRIAARQPTVASSLSKHLGFKASMAGVTMVSVFVKTSDVAEAVKIIEQWDGSVRTIAGNILTVTMPLDDVEALSRIDIIDYVEADRRLHRKLNQSLAVINADDVNDATLAAAAALPQAYTGSGVIVGIVDSGLDCDHADFNDDASTSRVLAYWDQTKTGAGVSEITSSSGTEYTGTEITDGSCTNSADSDPFGHGTLVTGIAVSNDATYQGVAPGARIVSVLHNGTTPPADTDGTFATAVADAVNYIFRKAQAQSPKMPVVVNLSLGTSIGAHDGTSLIEQSLDALLTASSGSEKQGRAIVGAAGNENFAATSGSTDTFGGIHATISQTAAQKAYDFLIRSATVFSDYGGGIVDIWLDSGSDCTIQIDMYSKTDKSVTLINMGAVATGGMAAATSNTDGTFSIALDFTDSANTNNAKQHAMATITRSSSSSTSPANFSFDLMVDGTCTGDAWLYPDVTDYMAFRKAAALSSSTNAANFTYVDGDSDRTMTIPGTGKKIIAVGSFMGAGTWTDINANVRDQASVTGGTAGAVSTFSSLGPSADARTKPDLVAPGEPIIATLASTVSSAFASPGIKGDATHYKLQGTSMASPHVAGAIALMFERNGCLTPTAIKSALTTTASSDATTGASLPDNTYGYGKVDVLAAVQAVTAASCAPDNSDDDGAGTGVTTTTGDDTTTTTTGGSATAASGGGNCTLIPR